MTPPDDRSLHRQSYERPDIPYRCGRGALWGKPCPAGPGADGACGGASECAPFRKGDAWQCRRSASAGGPCAEGPKPDGTCARTRPACVPRLTLRAVRGRLAVLSAGIVVALIAALLPSASSPDRAWSSLSPGPLSDKHRNFVGSKSCAACHEAHGQGVHGWARAVWAPVDFNARCTACHAFGGPAGQAHNTLFKESPAAGKESRILPAVQCSACHTEHKGAVFDITKMTDAQCQTCHKTRFESFASGHPAFPRDYPTASRQAVRFDHASHLGGHFRDPQAAAKSPKRCADCHDVRSAGRDVPPVSFEKACAACHAGQIRNDLVLLRLPDKNAESLSADDSTVAQAFLLAASTADGRGFAEKVRKLLDEMAAHGPVPLAARLDAAAGAPVGARLLAGANAKLLSGVAKAWGAGQSVETAADAPMGGWYWTEDLVTELRYKPIGHADPVVAAWLESAVDAERRAGDPLARERAKKLRDQLLGAKEGFGGCMKCHAVTAREGGRPRLTWRYRTDDERPFARFSHNPHVKLMDCSHCHQQAAETAGLPFQPIRKETCLSCHAAHQMRQDCRLCHFYHRNPSFKADLAKNLR